MAITNAQQYQQLVNKPADGKRPGYRGRGSKETKDNRQTYNAAQAAANIGRASTAGSMGRADPFSVGFDVREAQKSKQYSGVTPTDDSGRIIPKDTTKDTIPVDTSKPKKKPKKTKKNTLPTLNTAERFRVYNLKKAYERKMGLNEPVYGVIPNLIQSVQPTELDFYEESDPMFDASYYGMSGEDIADSDRLAKAINEAEKTGNITQTEFEDAFYGPDGPPVIVDNNRDDTPMDPCKGPNPPAYCFIDPPSDPKDPSTPSTGVFAGIAPRFAGSIFDFDALRAGAMDGGIMNNQVMGGMADGNIDEAGRQMYFLGKLVKKAKRAVKKVVKSPFGKIALLGLGAGMAGFGPAKGLFASGKGLGFKNFMTNKLFGTLTAAGNPTEAPVRMGGLLNFIKNNPYKSIFAGSTLLGLMGDKDDDGFDIDEYYRTAGLGGQKGIDAIRRGRNLAAAFDGSTYNYEDYAVGGRAGYQEGGDAEPVAKKTIEKQVVL